MSTAIQWTDVTDNIIVAAQGGWWCRKISPGCANCYADKLNQSDYFGGNHLPYTGKPPELKLREDVIDGWKRMRTPKKHFVASMTDVFGGWVPWSWAVRFLRGMWCAPNQIFQVLTKRPDVAADYIGQWLKVDGLSAMPSNIWIGCSVEDQKRADERIPHLLQIPATVRFLSCEPLLERIDLRFPQDESGESHPFPVIPPAMEPSNAIRWVIIGGESGPKARPCSIEWIRDIVEQCRTAGVSPFVKQLGKFPYEGSNPFVGGEKAKDCKLYALEDPKGGNINEWPKDLRVRQFPA